CPFVCDVDGRTVLLKFPDALSFQIASSKHCEAVRIARLNGSEIYSERVRQPALSMKRYQFSNAVIALALLQLFNIKVGRRPPARQLHSVLNYVRDFFDVAFNAPAINEDVLIRRHSLSLLQVA